MKTGFFFIDKPEGITSHDVVSRMRRILGMKKVGHSGTLDPLATGVLVVGCGPCTRLLDYVQAGIKEYVAGVRFGMKTSSGDAQGATIDECDMSSLTREQLEEAISHYIGEISQIPPMVSAVKVDGKKLYEYEREGIEIERTPRKVVIESIVIEEFIGGSSSSYPEARLRIRCQAGTYIRTLAEDIAGHLNGLAYLVSLRRTHNGTVSDEQCVPLDLLNRIEDPWEYLRSPRQALSHMNQVGLDEKQTRDVTYGAPLELHKDQISHLSSGFFVALGESPRQLAAVFPYEDSATVKSRCVVFLDEGTS